MKTPTNTLAPASSTATAFGGKTITVTFDSGRSEEVKVRQLPIRDYERAFLLVEDEIALNALICDRTTPWITGESPDAPGASTPEAMLPESYELLQATAEEVNAKGFFAWSGRKAAREMEQARVKMMALASLNKEQIGTVMDQGAKLLSQNSSLIVPPRPGLPGRR